MSGTCEVKFNIVTASQKKCLFFVLFCLICNQDKWLILKKFFLIWNIKKLKLKKGAINQISEIE